VLKLIQQLQVEEEVLKNFFFRLQPEPLAERLSRVYHCQWNMNSMGKWRLRLWSTFIASGRVSESKCRWEWKERRREPSSGGSTGTASRRQLSQLEPSTGLEALKTTIKLSHRLHHNSVSFDFDKNTEGR